MIPRVWIFGLLAGLLLVLTTSSLCLAQGPVGYYPFDGSTFDLSGNGNNGTTNGGVTWAMDRFGNPDHALALDGTTGYVNCGNGASLHIAGDITVCGWVRTPPQANGKMVASKYSSVQDNGWALGTTSSLTPPVGAIRFDGRDHSSQYWTSGGTWEVDDNAWHFLVGQRQGSVWKIYVDNQLASQNDVGSAGSLVSNFDLTIGFQSDQVGGSTYWEGLIDDLRIYGRAISGGEIDSLYHEGGWDHEQKGLVAYYPFTGGSAADSTGHGYDGTPAGGVATSSDRFGRQNASMYLNGSGAYVSTFLDVQPSAMSTTSWAFWVLPTRKDNSTDQAILSCDDNYTDRTVGINGTLDTGAHANYYTVYVGGTAEWRPRLPIFGQWQFVVLTYSPTNVYFYLDGVKDSLGSPGTIANTISRLQIGRNPGFGNFYQGHVDDIRIYRRALTDREIDSLYHLGGWAPPITWQDTLRVSNCDTTATLTFGQADSATGCIDPWLGEVMLPPAGPGGVFDARFILPCPGNPGSIRDFRNDSLTYVRWKLQFQPATCGYPFMFSWNPHALPDGDFRLLDGFGGGIVNIDMKRESTYTLTNPAISFLYILRRSTICANAQVLPAWNIVSVPVETPSPFVDSLFPGHLTPPYMFVPPQGYVRSDSMYPGHGYWLKFGIDTTYSICGLPAFDRVIHLHAGWNLIGPFECPVDTSDIVIYPPDARDSYYFGYDHGYQIISILLPGKGYWLHVNQPATLTIPECPPVLGGPTTQGTGSRGNLVVVSFIDQQGQGGRLYLSDGADIRQSLMPPPPPEGSADIRFTSNQLVEKLGTGSHPILMSSVAYPLRITVESTQDIHLELRTSTGALALESGKTVTLQKEEPLLSLIERTSSNPVPTEFALSQNYPNPFNPGTTLTYALPITGPVTLKVFDMLGREIATLVDGMQQAGFHAIDFDGASLASGVYMYRLQAGSCVSSRKMVLMK